MTELSALAGSEGYVACDDDDGGLYCKKGRRGLFYSHIGMTPAGAGVIYVFTVFSSGSP